MVGSKRDITTEDNKSWDILEALFDGMNMISSKFRIRNS